MSDGYDVLFQVDYGKAWKYMIETVGEAADYLPEIPLFIEPKYSETRVHCHIDSTSKALLLLKEVGAKNTGITLDMGHSLQSSENPAHVITSYSIHYTKLYEKHSRAARANIQQMLSK